MCNAFQVASIFLIAITLGGCGDSRHVWEELDLCKKRTSEDCTLIAVPESKTDLIHRIANSENVLPDACQK